LILEKYKEPRKIFDYYMNNNDALEKKLTEGEEKARIVAKNTISRMRQALGFGS
jgi:tryptophanyl-tRNA synthetase